MNNELISVFGLIGLLVSIIGFIFSVKYKSAKGKIIFGVAIVACICISLLFGSYSNLSFYLKETP